MDLTKLTDEALKALGYDQVKLLNQTQTNLTLIEQELAKRTKEQSENE